MSSGNVEAEFTGGARKTAAFAAATCVTVTRGHRALGLKVNNHGEARKSAKERLKPVQPES